jgi:hypothetical protein
MMKQLLTTSMHENICIEHDGVDWWTHVTVILRFDYFLRVGMTSQKI